MTPDQALNKILVYVIENEGYYSTLQTTQIKKCIKIVREALEESDD